MALRHEAYDIERADFARVIAAIRQIQSASMDELLSLEWLISVIRAVGFVPIPWADITYEGEEEHINASQQGFIQLPREFARWLLLLAQHRPATYLEIGCFNGATASIATAYLHRFNPALQATTLDVFPLFLFYREVRHLIPLRYLVGKTSFDLAGERFDAVFIDGDHSFEWAWADYENVGRAARICALHDINNAAYCEMTLGGVCGTWAVIRRDEPGEYLEFLDHPSRDIMGIGIRLNLT